jgi:plasmid stabilization system protein ParE
MIPRIQLTPQAVEDLDEIWWFIANDSRDAADRVEREILATCHWLAQHPGMGHKRQDTTPLPVRFWTITKFPHLSDRVPPGNCPVAGDRRAAWKAGSERSSQEPDVSDHAHPLAKSGRKSLPRAQPRGWGTRLQPWLSGLAGFPSQAPAGDASLLSHLSRKAGERMGWGTRPLATANTDQTVLGLPVLPAQ